MPIVLRLQVPNRKILRTMNAVVVVDLGFNFVERETRKARTRHRRVVDIVHPAAIVGPSDTQPDQ